MLFSKIGGRKVLSWAYFTLVLRVLESERWVWVNKLNKRRKQGGRISSIKASLFIAYDKKCSHICSFLASLIYHLFRNFRGGRSDGSQASAHIRAQPICIPLRPCWKCDASLTQRRKRDGTCLLAKWIFILSDVSDAPKCTAVQRTNRHVLSARSPASPGTEPERWAGKTSDICMLDQPPSCLSSAHCSVCCSLFMLI